MKLTKQLFVIFVSLLSVVMFVLSAFSVEAAAGPTITTTLEDNMVQKGSKKTFDVWAKNADGQKIKATVKLNGQIVNSTWDDNEKTSYTLNFTKEGENIVVISASSNGGKKKTLTYHITYEKAEEGEQIGLATWSVELFTIGCGYLIYPVSVPIYEGETAAEQLLKLLSQNGFVGYYGGTPKSAFYLAYIADGTATDEKYNNYQKSDAPATPRMLSLSPAIPTLLVPYLEDTMTFFEQNDYAENWQGYIGEFVFTNGSGWMYSVNHVFPNVGFADTYLSDGDVVRVQFTLGYGADIGGLGSIGGNIPNVDTQPDSGYYTVANKDELSETISKAQTSGYMARTNVKQAYQNALAVMETLNASQSSVDSAINELNSALLNPSPETNIKWNETISAIIKPNETNQSGLSSFVITQANETNPSGIITQANETNSSGIVSQANETNPSGIVSQANETNPSGIVPQANETNPSGIITQANETDPSTMASQANSIDNQRVAADVNDDRKNNKTSGNLAEGLLSAPETGGSMAVAANNNANTLYHHDAENKKSVSNEKNIYIFLAIVLTIAVAVVLIYIYQRRKKAYGSLELGGTNQNE